MGVGGWRTRSTAPLEAPLAAAPISDSRLGWLSPRALLCGSSGTADETEQTTRKSSYHLRRGKTHRGAVPTGTAAKLGRP